MHMTTTSHDTIIVGAGLAGLTAALHLAERGLRPWVLDADPQHAGGRLKAGPEVAFEHAGQTWHFGGEHGVHGVWSPYRNFQAMLVRHRIRPVLVPAQEEAWLLAHGSRVRRADIGSAIRNSWVPAPFHYLGMFARPRFWTMLSIRNFASLFRVFVTLLAALSIDPLAEDQPLYGMTLADVCKGWSPDMTSLFTGLSRNALPANPDQIPASGFFAFLRFYTLRRRDAWAFSYLPTDSARALIAPLLRVLEAHGGKVTLGARVTQLVRAGDLWQVTVDTDDQPPYVLTTSHLILATDAPAAETLLHASPDTAAEAEGLRLPGGWPSAVLRLWFTRTPERRGAEAGIFSGDFVLDNFFWLHRIYDDYIRWARATGGSALEAHLYGPPDLLAMPDAALLAHAITDVTRAWPELKGHVLHAAVTRNDATHTLLHAGRPEEHLGVVTPWPDLFCCGDWVRDSNPAMFMERACITGIKAANAVLQARELASWPLLAAPRPEMLAWAVEMEMRGVRERIKARRRKYEVRSRE
jgi:isorenieratene synthase